VKRGGKVLQTEKSEGAPPQIGGLWVGTTGQCRRPLFGKRNGDKGNKTGGKKKGRGPGPFVRSGYVKKEQTQRGPLGRQTKGKDLCSTFRKNSLSLRGRRGGGKGVVRIATACGSMVIV